MKKRTEPKSGSWRPTTPEEKVRFKKMALNTLKRLGRPHLPPELKYKAISIKLDPRILKWAKAEAKKRNIGYQTVINQELLKKAS